MTGGAGYRTEPRQGTEGLGLYRTCLLTVMLLVLGLLTHLWGVSKTMRQAEALERLRTERQELMREQERLKAEVSGLSQSSRIRGIAEKQLGMVFPQEPPRNLYLGAAGKPRQSVGN